MQKIFLKKFLRFFFSPPKFSFSSRGEKIIENVDRDLTKIQTVQEQLKEDHFEFIKSKTKEDFKPLSEAPTDTNMKKLGIRFSEDKTKLNKVLRKNYKEALQIKTQDLLKEALDEHETANLMQSRRENLRKIEEMKYFNQAFFRKNEILRQLRKQELSAENFLPLDLLNKDNFSMDLRQKFLEYRENLNLLKNNRIDNFLYHPNENKKLALLLQSGLLDNDKNITEIIKKSSELLHSNSSIQTQTPENSKEIMVLPKKEDFENDKDLYLSIINSMGLQLNQNLAQYDFEKLALFFDNIIKVDEQKTLKLFENFSLIKKIKNFEEFLMEQLYNNALDIRVKGRAKFEDMNEKESLNYVKYNIENMEDLFKMFDNSKQIHNVSLVSTMIQKISVFKLKKEKSILYIISDKRYGALLRYITTNINLLSNSDFVNTIWALSSIHRKEKGVIYHRIFNVLSKKLENEVIFLLNFQTPLKNKILKRLDSLNTQEFSFLLRSLLNFPNFDVIKNKILVKEIFLKIENSIANIDNLFVLQGVNLFLSVCPHDRAFSLLKNSFDCLNSNKKLLNSMDEKVVN